jgi:hypothetical protein
MAQVATSQNGIRVSHTLGEMRRQELRVEGDGAVEVARLAVGMPDVRRYVALMNGLPS